MSTLSAPDIVDILCFSKDRPFQLDGYLRSVKRFIGHPVAITVLYTSTAPELDEAYGELRRDFPDVQFVKEYNYGAQTLAWLHDGTGEFVLFGCDDVVFYSPVNLELAMSALRAAPEIIGFSLRLGKNISQSFTIKPALPPPKFRAEEPYLLWSWKQGIADWGYPFELNGTLYERSLVKAILAGLEQIRQQNPAADWRHPNNLESGAYHLLRNSPNVPPLMASFRKSCLVVPTVNQVQNMYNNRLLGEIRTARELEAWRRQGRRMDLDAYAAHPFDRIHVPEFFVSD